MTADIQELRRQLREKFPAAHVAPVNIESPSLAPGRPFEITTFPAGAISEIIPAAADSPLALWIAGLLENPRELSPFPEFVLIDGADRFDPASYSSTSCSRLLWVRCQCIQDALKATDILVRDGNIPFILLDLHGLPISILRSIPAATWWRFKQLCEQSSCRLVVLPPSPLVPCSSLRLSLSGSLRLEDFTKTREELLLELSIVPTRKRHVR